MKKSQATIVLKTTNYEWLVMARNVLTFKAVVVLDNLSSYVNVENNVHSCNKSALFIVRKFEENKEARKIIKHLREMNAIFITLTNEPTDYDNRLLNVDNMKEDFPKLLGYYNIDVGDHTSDSSGPATAALDAPEIDDEEYRNILMEKAKNHTLVGNEIMECLVRGIICKGEHIICSTKYHIITTADGAFFEGYVMIVPKRKIMSFGCETPEEFDEFISLSEELIAVMQEIYKKKVFMFECSSGKSGEGKAASSITYAHMHFACTDMPVIDEVRKSGLTPALINKRELTTYNQDPYMLYVSGHDWFISCDKREYYPRQHPRQVLAQWMVQHDKKVLYKTLVQSFREQNLDTPEAIEAFIASEEFYNWRYNHLTERKDIIAEEYRTYFRNHAKDLPELIGKYKVLSD